MISDDTFRRRLQEAISSINRFAEEIAPWARIACERIGDAWRVACVPSVDTACPFEIVIRPDQCFDMAVDGEIYEDIAFDGSTDLPAIVQAIAEGQVVIRRWASSSTGLLYDVETVIKLPDGREWRIARHSPDAPTVDECALISTPLAFTPYRR